MELSENKQAEQLNIHLDIYEGPLDALCNLVYKNQIDIADIKLTDITTQFISSMNEAKDNDIEISVDFINIATRLIFIKSSYILNKHHEDILALQEEEEELGRVLLEKIKEYKKYKDIALDLMKKNNINESFYFRNKPEIIEVEEFDTANITINDIHEAMIAAQEKLLFRNIDRLESEQLKHVNQEKLDAICHTKFISVEQKMLYLQHSLEESNELSFFNITKRYNIPHTIATFLASLELAKHKEVSLEQEYCNSDIKIIKNQ